jgi:hypothetical protein
MSGKLLLSVCALALLPQFSPCQPSSGGATEIIEDSRRSLDSIDSYALMLEQKLNDTETFFQEYQTASEEAYKSKEMELQESEAKRRESEKTSNFWKGFSIASGSGSLILTAVLVLVICL